MKNESMTVDELLSQAMALMGEQEKDRRGYTPFTAGILNTLMADCFSVNNALRERAGKEPLAEIPKVTLLTDVVSFEYEAMVNLLPYGLAFYLLMQDDENDKANIFSASYEANKMKIAQAQYERTEDWYR